MPQPGRRPCRGPSAARQSTIAWISARGVKYCPAPDLMSSAPLDSSSSYASPLMSVPVADQFSLSMRSTMSRLSLAGSWIRFCALRKIVPSVPGWLRQLFQDVPVGDLEVVAFGVEQPLPGAVRPARSARGLSGRVSRSCAILRNSRYVSCSVYSMVPTPSSRSTLQYDQSLSTNRRASDTRHLLHQISCPQARTSQPPRERRAAATLAVTGLRLIARATVPLRVSASSDAVDCSSRRREPVSVQTAFWLDPTPRRVATKRC